MQLRHSALTAAAAAAALVALIALTVATPAAASRNGGGSGVSGLDKQQKLIGQLSRLYTVVAGELAKDPARAAKELRAAAQRMPLLSRRGSGAFNEELSPECGIVFSSMLSAVLGLVGGVDLPNEDFMEFIKWLDSIGKPEAGILLGNVRWIGSREECEGLSLPVYQDVNNASSVMFRTNGRYCSFRVNASDDGNGTAFSGEVGVSLRNNLGLAVCMPNPCRGRDAEIALNYVIQLIVSLVGPILQGVPGIGGILDTLKSASLVVDGCAVTSKEAGSSIHYGAIAMITLTLILCAIILAFTFVNCILEYKDCAPSNTFGHICRAFCLRTNLTKLFAPPATDSLACLNGIRVLSIFWVILGHCLLFIVYFLDNPLKLLDDFRKRWQAVLIINATTSVDSFFLLSGTLVAYLFFKKIGTDPEKRRNTLKSAKFWLLYYFHRYWRLTPPLVFFVFWQITFLRYFGDGALMPKNRVMLDEANCVKNWWTLPLYVQNFVRVNEPCIGHTWYLANDMQMYLVSPLMLLPFVFGGLKIGSIICVIVVAISMVCTGVINAHYGFRRGHLNLVPGAVDGYDPNTSYHEVIYVKPYCRIGAYAIGILLGYVLATRKSIRLPWLVVLIGWLVAAAGSLALLYLVQPQIAGTSGDLTLTQVTIYWSFLRPGFALCVAWVAFACTYGYGGPVNLILSWSWFAPLAKLTYCAYLVHISVLYMFGVTYDTKFHLTDTLLIVLFLACVMATFIASLVLSMLIEAPLLGLEKALFAPASGSTRQVEANSNSGGGGGTGDLEMSKTSVRTNGGFKADPYDVDGTVKEEYRSVDRF